MLCLEWKHCEVRPNIKIVCRRYLSENQTCDIYASELQTRASNEQPLSDHRRFPRSTG